ncbi:NPP1 family protein [Aeromonas aquatica]|uniref:NPP1 family protein n=1 Tax=Aeromonas aquatica TaxID=558964 RepID=UPI00286F5309|nr:NPP1 family protein [Aeromonas aquatica]
MKSATYIFIPLMLASTFCAASEFPRLDEAYPSKINIRGFEPVFDFDNDGCYPAAGISRSGQQNPGLKTSGAVNGSCHDAGFLEISNTLHRYACIPGSGGSYCAQVYDMYFEKDQTANGPGGAGSHRHDWESVAVWTLNGAITHVSVSAHGNMDTREFSQIAKDGNHAKIVYNKHNVRTHIFRFASNTEPAENHYGYWVTPAVTSWYELKGDGISNQNMRNKLNSFDYGSASIKVKDSVFLTNINKWKPSGYPTFTQSSVEASNPNP